MHILVYSMGTKAIRRKAAVHYTVHSLSRGNLKNLMSWSVHCSRGELVQLADMESVLKQLRFGHPETPSCLRIIISRARGRMYRFRTRIRSLLWKKTVLVSYGAHFTCCRYHHHHHHHHHVFIDSWQNATSQETGVHIYKLRNNTVKMLVKSMTIAAAMMMHSCKT